MNNDSMNLGAWLFVVATACAFVVFPLAALVGFVWSRVRNMRRPDLNPATTGAAPARSRPWTILLVAWLLSFPLMLLGVATGVSSTPDTDSPDTTSNSDSGGGSSVCEQYWNERDRDLVVVSHDEFIQNCEDVGGDYQKFMDRRQSEGG